MASNALQALGIILLIIIIVISEALKERSQPLPTKQMSSLTLKRRKRKEGNDQLKTGEPEVMTCESHWKDQELGELQRVHGEWCSCLKV